MELTPRSSTGNAEERVQERQNPQRETFPPRDRFTGLPPSSLSIRSHRLELNGPREICDTRALILQVEHSAARCPLWVKSGHS